MPGQKVTFEVDAQHAPAIAAFLQVAQAVDATAARGRKAGDDMAQGGAKANDAWGRGLSVLGSYPAAFARMLTGATAVYAIIGQLRAEYERMGQVRESAYEGLMASRQGYREATWNIPPEYRQSKEFEQLSMEGIRLGGGRPAGEYFQMLGYGFSSAGAFMKPQQIQRAANSLQAVLGQAGIPAQESGDIMGALLRIMNVRQEKEGKPVDPEEMLGSLFSTFGSSPSAEMSQYMLYGLRSVLYQMQFQGASFKEAAAMQATMAGAINDLKERRGATGVTQAFEKLEEGFSVVRARLGVGRLPEGVTTREEWRALSPTAKLTMIRDDESPFGQAMQAWLVGGRSDNPRVRALSNVFGQGYMGAAFGEAGIQTIVEELFKKDSNMQERMQAIMGTIREGDKARALYEEFARPTPTNQQEIFLQQQAITLGTTEAMKWANTRKAQEGALLKMVETWGEIEPTGALQQTLRSTFARLKAPGMTDEQLFQAQIEEAQKMRSVLLGTIDVEGGDYNEQFKKWAAARGWPAARQSPGYASPADIQQFQRETISGPSRSMVESLENFIEQSRGLDMRRRSFDFRQRNPDLVPVEQPTMLFGAPVPTRVPPQPTADQSSMIEQLLNRMDQLAAALQNMQINVSVEDGVGRRTGYTTQRPHPLELLSQQALG